MIGRVIEIGSEGCQLERERGSMVVIKDGAEQGRIPLDDIGVLLCNARSITYSNSLLTELARRGVAVVLCGDNYLPAAWLWPVEGHHVQAMRMRFQLEAQKPLQKRLWQAVVREKVTRQKAALQTLQKLPAGSPVGADFDDMARRVRSGDPDNIEAQAARKYWPLLFGKKFRRERSGSGPNPLLNYGYTVLRAAVARAVVSAGLHPSLGMHHSNRGDSFCLADDLMEPYRPIVDCAVARLVTEGHAEIKPETKRALAGILVMDMETDEGTTPLQTCIERTASSLARAYETGVAALTFPHRSQTALIPPEGDRDASLRPEGDRDSSLRPEGDRDASLRPEGDRDEEVMSDAPASRTQGRRI